MASAAGSCAATWRPRDAPPSPGEADGGVFPPRTGPAFTGFKGFCSYKRPCIRPEAKNKDRGHGAAAVDTTGARGGPGCHRASGARPPVWPRGRCGRRRRARVGPGRSGRGPTAAYEGLPRHPAAARRPGGRRPVPHRIRTASGLSDRSPPHRCRRWSGSSSRLRCPRASDGRPGSTDGHGRRRGRCRTGPAGRRAASPGS